MKVNPIETKELFEHGKGKAAGDPGESKQIVIQNVLPAYPDSHTLMNTKVVNQLPDMIPTDIIPAENDERRIKCEMVLDAGGTGESSVEYAVILSVSESTPELLQRLDPFDISVLNAACTLWLSGIEYIWAAQIYKELTGGKRPSDTMETDIDKSLKKMQEIRLSYDYTAEIKRKYSEYDGQAKANGHILELLPLTLIQGGHEIDVYQILIEPSVLTHAKSIGQLITIKRELLAIKEVHVKQLDGGKLKRQIMNKNVSMNAERCKVRDYLIRRIAIYKEDHKKKPQNRSQPNRIRFDTILNNAEIYDKKQKTRAKDFAVNCMHFFAATGFISDFTHDKDAIEFTI